MSRFTERTIDPICRDATQYYRTIDDYLSREYGILTRVVVGNPEEKVCQHCKCSLVAHFEQGWVYQEAVGFYCPRCCHLATDITITHFPDAKMPHKIVELLVSIRNHPDYLQLNSLTRMEINGAERIIQTEKSAHIKKGQNGFLRQVWQFLYHGTENATTTL